MPHISFSELKIWNECPFKHKLLYLDGLKGFEGNEHTAFGTAVHSTCEQLVENNLHNPSEYFQEHFLQELQKLPKNYKLSKSLVTDMRTQGNMLVKLVLPALKEHFSDYTLFSVEEKLFEPVEEYEEYNFKGYIDLVIKTSDGRYHIIDWKTCSWGWNPQKKNDKMVTYQLTLYKHFFSLKHNVEVDKIATHFALLKRTAKRDNIEIFKVTSGRIKTTNALKLLDTALYNINENKHIKNRLSCHGKFGFCEFYKTEHCP